MSGAPTFAAYLVIALTLGHASAAGLSPYSLECEARRQPVGIDAARPRLSWKLRSDVRDQKQSAYQVLVSTTPDFAASAPSVWDSGRVASPHSAWVSYAGAPLRSFQRYWWRVRVWDAAGTPSVWSEPAEFTTAVLDATAWKAGWIAHPNRSLRSGPLPIFRKDVPVDRPLRLALAIVSGVGFHELRINGARVGDHVLAPAWTNYRLTVLYETHDVTGLLKQGPNAIGIMLGNGFYNVAGGRYTKYTGSFGHPRALLQLHLEYADGSTSDVGTDASWRVHEGPIAFSCIFGGEDYDARMEPRGWDRPGFDDSAWPRAVGVEPAGAVLRAQSSPPVRVHESFRPARTTEPKPGTFVYDLGRNFAGWPKITVSGASGTTVKITPGELLEPGGLVSQRSSGGPMYFSYTLAGAGRETWSPRFSYYGFRYLQVESGAATVDEVEGQFVHLDAPRAGTFECSNQLFNRIHGLIDAAVRSNLQHVLTDCPHREKLGWLEQSYLMGPSLLYNWDLRTFLPKIAADMREAQTPEGLVTDIAPEYVVFGRGFRDSPEWGSAAVLVPWLAWQWYGDRDSLAASWRTMERYGAYLDAQSKDGLLSYGLGDWYDIGPRGPGPSQLTPQGVTATATYLEDLRVLEQTARVLGREIEAKACAARAAAVHNMFQQTFFKAAETTYATGSQTSLAMPLALGIAPEAARARLVERLVDDIRRRGNHTSAGDIGYRYVLAALLDAGRSDVIYDMATQASAPSYAAQLAAGATSLTEAWDANPHSSQNHLMLGHIDEWFYAGLAGIRPDPASPGWGNVVIRPEPVGDVTWAKASVDTVRGPVSVEWRIESGAFRLTLDIPPGVTAAVHLPGRPVQQVGSGRREFAVPGLRP